MRQWDGSKISIFGNSQEHSYDFLSSVTITPLKCQEVFLSATNVVKPLGGRVSAPDPLGELTALPQSSSWWGRGWLSLPKNPTSAVLYSELWLCISKLLDLFMVG